MEIEKYGMPVLKVREVQMVLGCENWWINRMPIAELTMLSGSVAIDVRRIRVRTHRCEVHQAREANGPVVLAVNDVATIELWKRHA